MSDVVIVPFENKHAEQILEQGLNSEFLELTRELKSNKGYREQYTDRVRDINDAVKGAESYINSIKNEIKRSKGYKNFHSKPTYFLNPYENHKKNSY